MKSKLSDSDKLRLLVESRNIHEKYIDRVPVYILSKNIHIDKCKYLVPEDLSMSQFIFVLRKRIKLPAEQGLFFLINDIVPPSSALMSQLYSERMDPETEMLLIYISKENTFGL